MIRHMRSRDFKDSNTPSIDLYLARNPDLADLGKKAITISILEAEKRSVFGEDILLPAQDWYSYLYDRMTRDLTTSDSFSFFKDNKVAIATFNYDRSLESFLFNSLLHSFSSAGGQKIAEQIRAIPIFHMYGIIDSLPWQGGSQYRSESNNALQRVNVLYRNIKTVYEAGETATHVHEAIKWTDKVFFLGFGYAKENIAALGIGREDYAGKHIFGTVLGSTDRGINEIRQKLATGFPPYAISLNTVDCLQLLRDAL